MKDKILYILLVLLISQAGFCEQVITPKQAAFKAMQESDKEYSKACSDMATSFKNDNTFANFIRSSCSDFLFKKEKTINAIYAQKSSTTVSNKAYTDRYYTNRAAFVKELNNKNLEIQKTIVKEYCKYHKKEFPKACSALQ